MTDAAPAQCQPAARSTKQCSPRSGYRVRQAHPGSGGSPTPDSPARAARSVHGHQRRLRACRAADADTSTGARAATGANDEPRRLHEHAAPPLTRKHPSQRGQEHPIGRAAARPPHLPAKHGEFVTQNEYLDLVRGVRSTPHHQESEEMSKQPVEARDDHQTILPTYAPIRRTEFPAPSR